MANKLFIPGPVEVGREVLDAMSTPQIGHRTPEFKELFGSLRPGLQKLLYTVNDALISTSTGSGFWEAAIRCCVRNSVLHAVNGAFSKKWSSISESCGRTVERITYDFGKAVKADDVERALSEGSFEAFCMVHNETSTGVASDLESISGVMKKYPDVLFLIDAVSSLSGMKIEVDKLGIDMCFASSQKALALPPGLAVCTVSDRAYDRAKTIEGRGYYLDILELKKSYETDQTPYTASIPHLYGLKKRLELIEREGVENRFERHKEMADFVRQWAAGHGFEPFPEEGCLSDTVGCFVNTKSVSFADIKKDLRTKGYSVDSGYGKLNAKLKEEGKPQTFRIPTMGDITVDDLKTYTAKLEEYFY